MWGAAPDSLAVIVERPPASEYGLGIRIPPRIFPIRILRRFDLTSPHPGESPTAVSADFPHPWSTSPLAERAAPRNVDLGRKRSKLSRRIARAPCASPSDPLRSAPPNSSGCAHTAGGRNAFLRKKNVSELRDGLEFRGHHQPSGAHSSAAPATASLNPIGQFRRWPGLPPSTTKQGSAAELPSRPPPKECSRPCDDARQGLRPASSSERGFEPSSPAPRPQPGR